MVELRSEVQGSVALVTLDAPGRRNALSLGLVDEIVAAFDAIDADPDVGAVVVTGGAAGLLRRGRPVSPRVQPAPGPVTHLRGVPARRTLTAADDRRRQRGRGRRGRQPGAGV